MVRRHGSPVRILLASLVLAGSAAAAHAGGGPDAILEKVDKANNPFRDRLFTMKMDIKEADVGYRKYLDRVPMPFPVLHDATGDVTLSFTPPRAQPDITDRATVLVTSNLVLDTEGKIRFFTMVDTAHFDAKLVFARKAIDQLLASAGSG